MDFTRSDAFVVHPGTGQRMHQATEPVPTQVSPDDMNGLIWSLMEIIKDAGVTPVDFDADDPASYRQLVTALNTIYPRRVDVKKQASAAKRFWAAIRGLQQDVYWLSLSDSTGAGDNRWVRQTANQLATLCPTHTVTYRSWTDGSGWAAAVTVQTGTSGKTIYVDNCAVSGSNSFYAEGLREAEIWGDRNYDLVSLNYGDNYGTALTEDIVFPEYLLAAANARAHAPQACVVVVLQPPMTDVSGAPYSKRIVPAQLKTAQLLDLAVADFSTAFKTHPNPPSLYADTVHPNDAGTALCVSVFMTAIAEPADLSGPMPMGFNPLQMLRPVNFVTNASFADWPGATPANWTFNNCTPTKDIGTVESNVYSCKVTNTGANPTITQDLTAWLPLVRGRTVVIQARLKRQTGMDTSLAGRIGLTSSDGATSNFNTSFNRGNVSAGDWEYALVHLKVRRGDTSLTLTLYNGAAAGADTGKSINWEWVLVTPGVLPAGVAPDTRKFVTDYFADANAKILPGTTGTFSCTGGVMTISGASPLAEGVVNLYGLVTGETYRVTANITGMTGNTTGGIQVRNGLDGGVTDLVANVPFANGGSINLLFTAPNNPVSLRPHGDSGTTGLVISNWSVKPVTSLRDGARYLRLFDCRNIDGTDLATAPSPGFFGLNNNPGSNTYLTGEAAQANTKTQTLVFPLVLPPDYIPGRDITVTVSAGLFGTGTLGATKTLTLSAWKVGTAGVHGSNIGPAAATLQAATTDYAMVIAGAGLMPGDMLQCRLVTNYQESAGTSSLTFRGYSLKVS